MNYRICWISPLRRRMLSATMAVAVTLQLGLPSAFAVGSDYSPSKIINEKNIVTQYVNQEDGATKTIYWTQGVTPPKMGGENSDFKRTETSAGGKTYVEYIAPFVAGNGWFDTNKSISLEYDANLCFSAAATNTLHWWLNQNENYIEEYLQKNPVQAERLKPLLVHDQGQSGSPIYKIFVDQFAMRQEGYWPDILQDQFLNGYKPKANGGVNDEDWDGPQLIEQGPDKRGGFFYDVLKAKRLTRRSYYDSGYDLISKELKEHMQNGEIVLLSYSMGPAKSHVVTVWGVEYDQNGRLSAVYIADSDDEPNPTHGMMRYGVYRSNRGQAILSNRTDGSGTTIVESLQFLNLGDKQWKQYLGIEQKSLHLKWGKTKFTYNGAEHCPTVSADGIQIGDDVQLNVTGAASHTGTHTATVTLDGADAAKYEISGAKSIQYTILPASPTVQFTAKVQGNTINLHAVVSGLADDILTGNVEFKMDGNTIGSGELHNNAASNLYSVSEAGTHVFTATYIPSENSNYSESTSAPQTVDVSKQDQIPLTIDSVGAKVYGDAPFNLTVSGGSTNGKVTYTSSNPSVIRIDDNTATICGAGTSSITATMAGDDTYNSVTTTLDVTVDKAPAPQINYPTASPITYGQKLSSSVLSGGSTEFGGFAWENPDSVLDAGMSNATVCFTPDAETIKNYLDIVTKSHSVDIQVEKVKPTVTVRAESLKVEDGKHTILLSASVANVGLGDIPSGHISFYNCTNDDNIEIGSKTELQAGGAFQSWNNVAEERYCIRVAYDGDSNYEPVETETEIDLRKVYAITLSTNGHGRAEATFDQATAGTLITLKAIPDSGYQFKEWEILYGDIQVNNSQFIMPAKDVSVKAIFEKVQTPGGGGGSIGGGGSGGGGGASGNTEPQDKPTTPEPTPPQTPSFSDVPNTSYYADAVKWATEKGITSGVTDTLFAPNSSCTRAQMVTFLWRVNGSPVVNYAMKFTDVPADAYYAEAVRWAVSKGITSGTTETTFSPDAMVTRAQTVSLLYRHAGSPAVSGNNFADVNADAYYANAVAWAVAEEITAGTSTDTFSPNAACTRGQIVSFLYRAQ